MDYPEPTLYAIPFFLVTLWAEPIILSRSARKVVGYERRDTKASLGMGLGSLLFATLVNLAVFSAAKALWPYRLFDLGHGVWGWAVAMVGWDFSYYWHHRAGHRIRLLWACHVSHHSSRHYNLSTALRQPWTPVDAILFFPIWALLGVEPWMILFSGGLNLIYQYWIHTEAVNRMPGWFEAVLNTPSHHRVHHGSNPEYLDKNYGGILIVWDRLFGTFEKERAPVQYGLTKNIESFSLGTVAFHEYVAIFRDVCRVRGTRERLGILLHGPEWTVPGNPHLYTPLSATDQ